MLFENFEIVKYLKMKFKICIFVVFFNKDIKRNMYLSGYKDIFFEVCCCF